MVRQTYAVICILLFSGCLTPERLSRDETTFARMMVTHNRIRKYWELNDELPERLAALPLELQKDNSTLDGWGNPLQYEVLAADSVRITSLGQDRKPGGVGNDADSEFIFNVQDQNSMLRLNGISP